MIGLLNSIKSADLDNDGKEEIVFGNEEGNIYVMGIEGSELTKEWLSPYLGGKTYGLALGDVDSDSTIEIVVGSADGYVRVFGWSGATYELEWESPDLGHFAFGLDVGDVDDDEYQEIVVGTGEIAFDYDTESGGWWVDIKPNPIDENLFIFGFDGTTIEQEWSTIVPALFDVTGIYNIAIGDTDDDSTNEIVIGTFEWELNSNNFQGRYGIYGFNGLTYSPEWSIRELGNWIMGMGIGDTDDDNYPEIVIAVWEDAFYVYGYQDGVYFREWQSSSLSPFTLAVGDTDDDGIAEIIESEGNTVNLYESSGVEYSRCWTSGDLDKHVTGLGVGQTYSNPTNEVLIADDCPILVYGYEVLGYELKVLEEGFGSIASLATWDMDEDGLGELYVLLNSGTILILELDRGVYRVVRSLELPKGDKSEGALYTQIIIADFNGDGEREIVAVEGNTSISIIGGNLAISARFDSTLFFIEFTGSDYSIADQVYLGDNGIFSVDFGDIDNDGIIEVVAGGSNGDMVIIGYTGSSYGIEDQIHVCGQWITCVGTGDTDGDEVIEIGLGDDSSTAHIVGYDGAEYVVEWNTTLDQLWMPLALEIGSIDEDDYEEIFIKGAFSEPLSIHGWNGSNYDEEERLDNYNMTSDEGLLIREILSIGSPQLLISSLGSRIIEYDGGYSEVWVGDVLGTNAISAGIGDIDDYIGNELIVALDSMIFIYCTKGPPKAVLSVDKTSASIGEKILFDGSESLGSAPLKYFFDFGDTTNTDWITDSTTTHSYSTTGVYTASLKVRDEDGTESTNSAEIYIIVLEPNQVPIAYIDQIEPNPAIEGEAVSFKGHGFDEDGMIMYYSWTSDINGELSNLASFSSSSLSVGTHTVYFKVKDNNETWSENVTATLVIKTEPQNQVPIAYIDSISPNPSIEGEIITFSGQGIDNDGTIISYSWESNINGLLSDKSSFNTSSLSAGTYTISFKVLDNNETWSGTDTTTLTIDPKPQNQAPIACIDSVAPNPAEEGDTIYFTGHGVDNDGTITSYSWESDIDGLLSTEQSFSTSSLSIGEHIVTFKVKDDKDVWSESMTLILIVKEKAGGEGEPSDETDDEDNVVLFAVLLGIILLVIVVIIATLIAQTQKRKSGTGAMQVSCPGCGSVFDVTSPIRPLTVQCSNCGLSGFLNE